MGHVIGRAKTGDGDRRFLEVHLFKAGDGLEKFSRQVEEQSVDLKPVHHEVQQARESAASIGL